MSRWLVIEIQSDPLTHIVEELPDGALLKYCSQLNVLKSIINRTAPALVPLTCMVCAAYWSPS